MGSRPWEREALALAPVFIVGNARSGTSILYRSIQSHPSFTPSEGPDLVEAKALTLLPQLLRREDVEQSRLSMFLKSVDALSAVAQDIEPLARRRMIVRRIARHRFVRRPPVWLWKAAGEHHVVRRYFLEAHRRRGAPRLVEKTPRYIHYVAHLRAAFPQARFICIIRHPLDVFSSYLKRYEVDPEGSARANLTPERFCARWERVTRAALTAARGEPRLLLLRYENFITHTESTMRVVLDHVGEPFDEACLLQGQDPEPSEYDRHLPDAARNAMVRLRKPVSAETKRWEDHVDAATAQYVERRLRDTMALAGYEPKAIAGSTPNPP